MRKEFKVHILSDEGIGKVKLLAEKFSDLLDYIEQARSEENVDGMTYCTNAKELAIVATKLEEASFFAKKAMAMCYCIPDEE